MIPGCPDTGEYRDARGRLPVDPDIFKQPHSLILGVAGQSMSANFAQLTPYNPWTGGVYELDTVSGNIYQVTDGSFPTMGMNGWFSGEVPPPIRTSVLPYWGDLLVATHRCNRVLLAGHSTGGITARQMSPVGDMYARSSAVLAWLISLGIPPNFWVEMQGQADLDQTNPTAATTAKNYADLRKWRWAALRSAGLTCPIVQGQGAHWTGFSNVDPDRYALIKKGQALAVKGVDNVILGPDDDEWPDLNYRVDGVHPADGMRYWQFQRWFPVFPTF